MSCKPCLRPVQATIKKPMPKMIFIDPKGGRREVDAPLGLSVLEIAHMHGIDLEGACEGSGVSRCCCAASKTGKHSTR